MPGDPHVERARAGRDAARLVGLHAHRTRRHDLARPQLPHLALEHGGQAHVLTVEGDRELVLAGVERGDIALAARSLRGPQDQRILPEHLPRAMPLAVHREHVGVLQQRDRRRIGGGQISPHHQRGAGDHPQRHQGAPLVGGEQVIARLAPLGADPDPAQRQHVPVGPAVRAGMRGPAGEACEVRLDVLPAVPQVIADPPHRGVLAQVLEPGQGQVAAGGEAQLHGPAAAVDRGGERLDLRGLVRPEHVVDLEEVHAPARVQREHRVVVRLRARHGVVDAHHVRVPLAGVGGIGDVRGAQIGAEHGRIDLDGTAGDPAHHVDPELQAQRMDLVGERAESGALPGTREAHRIGHHPSVLVHHQRGALVVAVGAGRRVRPVDVHHHRVPSELGQVLGDEAGIGQHLRLGDGGAVAVPGVPAHRRAGRTRGGGGGHLVHSPSSRST